MKKNLLTQLKDIGKNMSVNELKNISPGRLMDLLNIDKAQMKDFADYLHKEYVLSYKYDFKCNNCGANCIAYERKIKSNIYICKSCCAEIENDVILKKGWITYNIDKNEMMGLDEKNNIDLVSGTLIENKFLLGSNKVIELVRKRDNKMKIFIGSSKEAKSEMERLARFLEEFNCEVVAWSDSSTFVAGDFTLESLIKVSKQVDAALFVFNGEDETWYRESVVNSVRDNVLLEYGLFVGTKGRKNVIFMCKNSPKIATDLLGIKYLDAGRGDFTLKNDIKVWLERIC
ncbi:Predicted nucleotide-binding protein containing TIR-like domain-containing protein [Clostridium amylolyticum]|uniref:Predicted nucleotide-binding protein containing TIR-like domain-containing protein n=1 Tax=Clostridium amylolyticum TaxID=1121298 RepID=A0A1M6JA88_9CLOT|nr:TIR domain-containing protein [Clostridium amylolyticum]SHJ43609.1 Predicted nucleotide-binding protein containing TIR-like domain-containing protein [Clostridium amylolyticum]